MPSYISQGTSEHSGSGRVEPGKYGAIIKSAKATVAKTGAEMIELQIAIDEGPTVFDRLIFKPSSAWKIDAARAACGFASKKGEAVTVLPEDFIGRRVRVEVGVEPGLKDPTRLYNCIKAYLPAEAQEKDDIFF